MSPIGKLELYGIAFIVLLASLAGMWFYAKHEGRLEERAVWEVKQAAATKADLQELIDAQAYTNTLATETKDAIGKIKVVNITRQGVIEREIKTDVRYVNDCFPESGRLQWNAISAGRPIMPSTDAGQQPDGRGTQLPSTNVPRGNGQQGRNPLAKP